MRDYYERPGKTDMPILRRDHQGGGEALSAVPPVADTEVFPPSVGYDAYPRCSNGNSLGRVHGGNVLVYRSHPES